MRKFCFLKGGELPCNLVKSFIEVKKGHYQILVLFKSEILKTLSNDFLSALQHTLSMPRTASMNPQLNQISIDTFAKVLDNG